jgi:Flp pilus assembly protein CpaB
VLWRSRAAVAAVAVALAVGSAVHALAPAPVPTRPVVVAARDLPAGTTLAAADLRVEQVPDVGAGWTLPDGPASLAGSTTAVPLSAGEPVVAAVLVPAQLRGPAGTVVTTVRLSDPALAGLLTPGTRVDVLAAAAEGGPGTVVARRALVLPRPAAAGGTASGGLLGGGSDDEQPPVLLAVARDDADDLAGAAASASLSALVVP